MNTNIGGATYTVRDLNQLLFFPIQLKIEPTF